MNFKLKLRQKKFFLTLFFFMSAMIFLVISAFSGIVYYTVGNRMLEFENNNAKKLLIQTKSNVENIGEIIKSICVGNYYSNDTRDLMYLKSSESYQDYAVIDRLNRTIIALNPFIHSIYIYNNNNKTFYSTLAPLNHEDRYLRDYIKNDISIPVLKPIIRSIESIDSDGKIRIDRVITYFFYEQTDSNNMLDGAFIINVKLDWLYNSIEDVNSVEKKDNDLIFLMDKNGQFINYLKDNYIFNYEIKEYYYKNLYGKKPENEQIKGSYSQNINGKKYMVTYINLEKEGWIIFKARSKSEIYSTLSSLRILLALLALGLVILFLFLALGMSYRIYRPIKETLRHIKNRTSEYPSDEETKDEISLIQETIGSSLEKLHSYQIEKINNKQIIKTFFLRQLLLESNCMKEEEFIKECMENNVQFSAEGLFGVCVVVIDRYNEFKNKHNEKDQELYLFGLSNIVSEIFASEFPNETVKMRGDQVVVVFSLNSEMTEYQQKIKSLLKYAQETIQKYYGFTFTSVICNVTGSLKHISVLYREAVENSVYKFIFGSCSIITPELIKDNINSVIDDQIYQYENKFLELIRSGKIEKAKEKLTDLFNDIKAFSYIEVTYFTFHLTRTFSNLIYEINQERSEPINISSLLSKSDLMEFETVDELKERILCILGELEGTAVPKVSEKQLIIAEAVREIIQKNYCDSGLSASAIADMLRLSSAHVGRVFKEHMGLSIPEYINEIRLAKAVEWLLNSKFSVNEIVSKVGFENSSYFYKVFKNKFGTSPREYVQKGQN